MRQFHLPLLALCALGLFACGDGEATPKKEKEKVFIIPEPDCTSDAQCVDDPNGPVCNLTTETCEAECVTNDECTDPARPVCNADAKACERAPSGSLLGVGAQSVKIVKVFTPAAPIEAPDLAFHPTRDELWIVNRQFEVEGVCSQDNPRSARCRSLEGTTTTLFNPGKESQRASPLKDGNAWHFMRRPPALAMGDDLMFATCGEARTGNFEDVDVDFIGPSLWTTDLNIHAQPSGANGSHMDMLHATPYCMGIAHERDNIYWVFNGNVGSIDRYDFHDDHGPGADDHSDGEIYRYIPGEVVRVPNVPSHMEYHDADDHVYVVDTGNARVIKLDASSGNLGGPFTPVYEPLAGSGFMDGAVMTPVVTTGLDQPSGLAIYDDTLYVSDHATGKFHAFDMQGNLLETLDSGLSAGSLAGIDVSPDGQLWFTDMKTGEVYKVEITR